MPATLSTDRPLVSFIVPCYKLAHLLAECVHSILGQTYRHIDVLIMDDCSPDHTRKVATSFQDSRVTYVRNVPNLGHLRNYNKGIELSRGKYVWLISADDRLRCPWVLERYVELMESHPEVGYVFCPGVGLQGGVETGVLDSYYYGAADRIVDGRDFIATVLRNGGGLASPSVMVRRDCYQNISMFPLDMPHQGDLYLWFAWALEYDVAYLAEPMVNYRLHDLNMMKELMSRVPEVVFADEVNVLWRTKRRAEEKGYWSLARQLEDRVTRKYANAASLSVPAHESSNWPIGVNDCVQAMRNNAVSVAEHRRLLGQFYAHLGDKQWQHGLFPKARRSYVRALTQGWQVPGVWLKLLLASMGTTGVVLRQLVKRLVTLWQGTRSRRVTVALKSSYTESGKAESSNGHGHPETAVGVES